MPHAPIRYRAARRHALAMIAAAAAMTCTNDRPSGAAQGSTVAASAPPKSPIELVPLPPDAAAADLKVYRLTRDQLSRWAKTQAALNQMSKAHPEIIMRMQQGAPPRSLDEMIARIAREPALRDVIKQSGSNPHDYVIAMVALQQALAGVQHTAAGRPIPSDAPAAFAANVQFVRDDLTIVQKMMGALPK